MSIEDRQLLDIGKMVGLTIKGVSKEYANGQMAISFSSGQFIILEAEHDGYGDARILVDEYPPYPSNIMVEAKVFTEKEHDAWEEKEKAVRESVDRAQFLRLKTKYEPGDSDTGVGK